MRTRTRRRMALLGAAVDAGLEVAAARQSPPAGSAARPRRCLKAAQAHGLVTALAGHADERAARRARPLCRAAPQESGCLCRGLHTKHPTT